MRRLDGVTVGEGSGAAALEALVAGLDYPMAIVTVATEDERGGCLVGFWTQCSIDPPRLLVCLSKRNRTYRLALRAEALAVHFLRAGDLALASLFGERTGDDTDKLAQCRWQPGPDGLPILDDVRGWVAGRVLERTDVGDHAAFLLAVADGRSTDPAEAALTFQQVKHFDPGHDA